MWLDTKDKYQIIIVWLITSLILFMSGGLIGWAWGYEARGITTIELHEHYHMDTVSENEYKSKEKAIFLPKVTRGWT